MSDDGRRPTSPNGVFSKEREREALELRKAGASYDQIAQRLDVSRDTARAIVMRALENLNTACEESADEIRRLEVERIDTLLLGLWDKARKGDVAAVDRVLRLQDRRAKLLGLDAAPAAPPQPTQPMLPAGEVLRAFVQLAAHNPHLVGEVLSGDDAKTISIPPPSDSAMQEAFGITDPVVVERRSAHLDPKDFKRLVAKGLKR